MLTGKWIEVFNEGKSSVYYEKFLSTLTWIDWLMLLNDRRRFIASDNEEAKEASGTL